MTPWISLESAVTLPFTFTSINWDFFPILFINLAKGLPMLLPFEENNFWLVLYIENLLVSVLLSPALIFMVFFLSTIVFGSDLFF